VKRVYIDSNVFLYAMGTEHPRRDPCRKLLHAIDSGSLRGETSVETLQEVVNHRLRRGDPKATANARAVAAVCSVVHELDDETMAVALDLLDAHPGLWSRDAVHAATIRTRGLSHLISADRDFDGVDGVVRIDPSDSNAVTAFIAG
jgi:uncharacterized protein